MILAVTTVSAYKDLECFWTGHNCYRGSSAVHPWVAQAGEQDPRIQYSWEYNTDSGDWEGTPGGYANTYTNSNTYYGGNYYYDSNIYYGGNIYYRMPVDYERWSREYRYPTIVDYGRWGDEEDYGWYYYQNRVWRDSDELDYYPSSNYFYTIKNEKMDPLYKKGCWNGHCEWYNINDPHDYIRWVDLQNAINDEAGNHTSTDGHWCYHKDMGYYYC